MAQWTLRNLLGRRPDVVVALQSPHLLNVWAQSKYWTLYCDLLGDHEGLEEAKDLHGKWFAESGLPPSRVKAVLVTSPMQLENARKKFPGAKIFWVVHTGYFLEVLPSEHVDKIDGIVTLTQSVKAIQLKHKPGLQAKSNFVITPFYEATPTWRWKEDRLWTIRSRPSSRMAVTKSRFEYVIGGINTAQRERHCNTVLFFGQEAPDGYLNEDGKRDLFSQSSAYISALPEDAGFGLAEHEALAHGVPIVGSRWGDIDKEISTAYASLTADQDEMIRQAVRLSTDKSFAEEMSRLGLEYIERYRTRANMDAQIKPFARSL